MQKEEDRAEQYSSKAWKIVWKISHVRRLDFVLVWLKRGFAAVLGWGRMPVQSYWNNWKQSIKCPMALTNTSGRFPGGHSVFNLWRA